MVGTLHVAPGDSAGGSIEQGLRDAGAGDEVVRFPDDLSCGPIGTDDPAVRAAWWAPHHDPEDVFAAGVAFWRRVEESRERLVVWFGRRSAAELAFFLAWTERMGSRAYDVVDVTGFQHPVRRRDGSVGLSWPAQCVALVTPDGIPALLVRRMTPAVTAGEAAAAVWRGLKQEDARFRVVTEGGLVSAADEVFDPLLLRHATREWQPLNGLIGRVMGHESDVYIQTGDMMLHMRIVALVGAGVLVAEGDPWERPGCKVRLGG